MLVFLRERSSIRRLSAIALWGALSACATGAESQKEWNDLRAELRSMRESQQRLSRRLERLELHQQVRRGATAGRGADTSKETALPSLTVVKLKPKIVPAPPLPTQVAVVEPAADQVEQLTAALNASGEGQDSLDQPDPAVLDAEFEQAVAALRTGNVEGGVTRLSRFAEENPRHPQADNALYFSGLGRVGLQDFEGASETFEQLLERYPAGDAVLDGMLRLAECRMRMKKTADAKALYTRVLTQYPGTAAATQAEQRLASISQ